MISFKGLDDATTHAWYVEMSKRIGTAGHASGIALYNNGNAQAIDLNIKTLGAGNDTAIVATSKFMKAGTFDAAAWGPVIRGPESVSTKDGPNHQGVSARDLLEKNLGAPAMKNNGAAPGSLQL